MVKQSNQKRNKVEAKAKLQSIFTICKMNLRYLQDNCFFYVTIGKSQATIT